MYYLEPKAGHKKLVTVARKLGFVGMLHGLPFNSHIWIFYKDPISVSTVSVSSQHITCMVDNSVQTLTCSISYASNKVVNRRKFWSELSAKADNTSGSLVLMGDFNAVNCLAEKAGGR